MHGRVKVRTSEEEKARKEKERQEKLKVCKHAMQKIFSKRKQGELDEELLNIIGKVLQSNPDIYTLWNIRREILTKIQKSDKPKEELSKLYDDELSLTEYCLKINPKSYCAWHQREWVLMTRSDPDWKKELSLCNMYLKLDERNFHTWDYRRFVVSQCKPPLNEEFNYTTEKLLDNFSNYSAWHYRSKMLVELYPDLEGGRPIEDSHHKQELKMVQSAAFTDPDDTSAWFYQRWLLDAVKDIIQLVVCTVAKSKTTFAFNKTVSQDVLQSITLIINEVSVTGSWASCTDNKHDCLWIFKHDYEIKDGLEVKVEYNFTEEKQVLNCIQYAPLMYVGKNKIDFRFIYSQPVIEELNNQLESCRQLLNLEPDSKWTLLTTTVFLHCIDAKTHQKEALINLNKLKEVDKLRLGYYNDLITKWSIEDQLINNYKEKSLEMKVSFDEKLTSLPHLQYYSFCENVDLSGQNLTSKVLPSLIVLQHCKILNLKDNELTTLKNFPMLQLKELNLEGNSLPQKEVNELKKHYYVKF